MGTRIVLLNFLICSLSLVSFAQPVSTRLLSRYEIKRDLLGQIDQGIAPAVATGDEDVNGRRKPSLAAIYSLLLPGMGELYAEGFASGKYFLIAEGALWLAYAAFDVYGNALSSDAREYAKAHAGISLAGKADQFFVDIGNFINTAEYNDKKLRDREAEKVYDPQAGYHWQWDSDAARAAYKDQRIASDNVLNNRKFVIAAIVINHVASAINAARAAISHNNDLEESVGSVQFGASVMGGLASPHGIMITMTKNF